MYRNRAPHPPSKNQIPPPQSCVFSVVNCQWPVGLNRLPVFCGVRQGTAGKHALLSGLGFKACSTLATESGLFLLAYVEIICIWVRCVAAIAGYKHIHVLFVGFFEWKTCKWFVVNSLKKRMGSNITMVIIIHKNVWVFGLLPLGGGGFGIKMLFWEFIPTYLCKKEGILMQSLGAIKMHAHLFCWPFSQIKLDCSDLGTSDEIHVRNHTYLHRISVHVLSDTIYSFFVVVSYISSMKILATIEYSGQTFSKLGNWKPWKILPYGITNGCRLVYLEQPATNGTGDASHLEVIRAALVAPRFSCGISEHVPDFPGIDIVHDWSIRRFRRGC